MRKFAIPRDEEIFIKHILKVASSSYVLCFYENFEDTKAII